MTDRQQQNDTALAQEREGTAASHTDAPIVLPDGTVLRDDKGNAPIHRAPDSSYQNYLFGSAGSGDRPAWSDSVHGRATIRLISRGIVGAAFFTIGGRMARSQMEGYNELNWQFNPDKPLQAIAKGIDMSLGKGIKKAMSGLAELKYGKALSEEIVNGERLTMADRIGRDAVTFRPSREFNGSLNPKGRSYGAEVVSFTFDFAMASIGDATTRNVIQALDPNIKKKWLVNDNGDPAAHGEKKHFKVGEAAKAMGRASWRIFSKNQLEDWAAAVPYAFQMKFQRRFLSNVMGKRFDGQEIVFDHGWNGGAYKVGNVLNKEGALEKKIIGDYQLAGAIDLHLRFTGYNWYTLMFREGYDTVGHALREWKDHGFKLHAPKMPEHFNPITATVDGIGHSMRYVTKSFIKANMYMNPAVVPFWVMRVSQSKWRGRKYVDVSGMAPELNGKTRIFSNEPGSLDPYASGNYEHYPNETLTDKVEKNFSKGLNVIGKGQYYIGNKAGDFSETLGKHGLFPRFKWFNNLVTYDFVKNRAPSAEDLIKGRRNFMHELTDASLSYTPYMFAKAELGLLVDDNKGDGRPGQMDQAIYRFMDNVATFNLRGVMDSGKEMWKLGTHFERDVKMREGSSIEMPKAPVVIPGDLPMNRIEARSIERSPASLDRANDNEHSANDNDDRSWAKNILNRSVHPSQLHSASATRH